MKHVVLINLVCAMLLTDGTEVLASDTLKYNPFEQPETAANRRQKNTKSVNNELQLRGTVIDGEDSLVNISGKFYRLNQEVDGYRVVYIKSASVTLSRGNNKTVLTLNNDE